MTAQEYLKWIGCFWATHTSFTDYIFTNYLSNTMVIGIAPHKGILTTYGQIFGAFYSSISKTSTGSKRSSLDQARMQLLQQLVAAKLNCAAFGCSSSITTLISGADAAYAGSNATAILNYESQLDAYNSGPGDNVNVPNSLAPFQGSATPKTSQAIANVIYWNSP